MRSSRARHVAILMIAIACGVLATSPRAAAETFAWSLHDAIGATRASDSGLVQADLLVQDRRNDSDASWNLFLPDLSLGGSLSRASFSDDPLSPWTAGLSASVPAVCPEASIGGREALAYFLILTSHGVVPLKHFFDFTEGGGRIFRVYARMPVGSPAADRLRFEAQVRSVIQERMTLPPGYSITFENPQSELDEAIRSLFVALGVSVVLIYLVVAFQFNSLRIPLVILVTVPLGFIGVVASLDVFNSALGLNSLLGTILLGGIVVNNAILMIDFYVKMADRHESRTDALVRAAGLRFPPIVITMLTTILGMLPLAIGIGEGSNIVQPLGIAVSGGLLVSTLFTLYVVPAILRFMRFNIKETQS